MEGGSSRYRWSLIVLNSLSAPESSLSQGIRTPGNLLKPKFLDSFPGPLLDLQVGPRKLHFQRVPTEPLRLGITAHNVRGHRPLERETLALHHEFSTVSIATKAVEIGSSWVEVGEKNLTLSLYKAQIYI